MCQPIEPDPGNAGVGNGGASGGVAVVTFLVGERGGDVGETPAALTIAGSDSGGGAGIQADLKTFSALGVYGASAVTAVTAQNTQGVRDVAAMTPEMVATQIDAVLSDITIAAAKTGMLGEADVISAVVAHLPEWLPVVVDPVMVAKSGDVLLPEAAIAALAAELLPRAALLTPNLPEAARLLGEGEAETRQAMAEQGRALIALGPRAVLMKGGHARGDTCTDLLVTPESVRAFEAPRIPTRHTHGTGCTLSAAVAAGLAKGQPLADSVDRAHVWLQGAIRAADRLGIGQGRGPVHHFHEIWS